jgi:hypothetical protein
MRRTTTRPTNSRERTLVLVVIVLATLAALSSPSFGGTERIERTIHHETGLRAGEALLLENLIGSLTVRADRTRGRALVEARVVAEADSRETARELAEAIVLSPAQADGRRVLRVGYPLERHSAFRLPRSEKQGFLDKWVTPLLRKSTVATVYDGRTVEIGQGKGAAAIAVNVVVTLPLDVDVACRQLVGSLHVVGARGSFNLEAVEGEILAEQIYGKLDVRTGGGEVLVRKFSGEEFRLQTSSGNVTLIEVRADSATLLAGSGTIQGQAITSRRLDVDSGGGDVRLSEIDVEKLDVESESGTIDLAARLTRTREASIRSADGDVTLRINPTTPFELRAASATGSVKHRDLAAEIIEEEKNSVHLARGKGGAALEVSTGKGEVLIRPS